MEPEAALPGSVSSEVAFPLGDEALRDPFEDYAWLPGDT